MARANFEVGKTYSAIGAPKAPHITVTRREGARLVNFTAGEGYSALSEVIDDGRTEKVTYEGVFYSAMNVVAPLPLQGTQTGRMQCAQPNMAATPKAEEPDVFDKYYRLNDTSNQRVDRINANTVICRGKTYDLNALAFGIGNSVDRNGVDYQNHKDIQIDLTMSCDKQEAIGWMDCWMMEAIFGGDGTPDFQLRAKFLAAYDTWCSLTGRKRSKA